MAIGISAVILCVLTRCDLNVCATYVLVAAIAYATCVLVAAVVHATYVPVAAVVCATCVLVVAVVCATCVLVATVEAESERVQPCACADARVQVLPFLEVY